MKLSEKGTSFFVNEIKEAYGILTELGNFNFDVKSDEVLSDLGQTATELCNIYIIIKNHNIVFKTSFRLSMSTSLYELQKGFTVEPLSNFDIDFLKTLEVNR